MLYFLGSIFIHIDRKILNAYKDIRFSARKITDSWNCRENDASALFINFSNDDMSSSCGSKTWYHTGLYQIQMLFNGLFFFFYQTLYKDLNVKVVGLYCVHFPT